MISRTLMAILRPPAWEATATRVPERPWPVSPGSWYEALTEGPGSRYTPVTMRTYSAVLTGTDFSALAQTALRAAQEMAQRFDAQRLHIVHVVARRGLPLPSGAADE